MSISDVLLSEDIQFRWLLPSQAIYQNFLVRLEKRGPRPQENTQFLASISAVSIIVSSLPTIDAVGLHCCCLDVAVQTR
ncbi:hypothetical protein PM082_014283 [Marasmius tenuissimus]|nr:hypothetical protein PM082_014283 [Marasmius tenuissimus]